MKNKIISLLIVLLSLASTLSATTWKTRLGGYWHSSQIWLGGVVPTYSSADTFIIRHPVAFEQNISFNTGAYIRIDSTGGLCGHHTITLAHGVNMLKYGVLEADTLFIKGGYVNCYGPGEVVLTRYAVISNGGSLHVNGCSLAVGPWFTCVQPMYAFTMGVDDVKPEEQKIYPNPALDKLFVKTNENKSSIEIFNLNGIIVITEILRSPQSIDISRLPQGIYLVRVKNEKDVYTEKIVKQ